jgi:hypothetical protein
MKSPRMGVHPARIIIGDSIWQIKKAGFSLRTKNEHMNMFKTQIILYAYPSIFMYYL